jgi:ketosteroid isomerase-like protein
MTEPEMIELVGRYFAAVDGEDFAAIAATLTEDCVFTVETHGIRLEGIDDIRGMFDRLWADHAAVRHYDFVHVVAPGDGRVASRFTVVNTLPDGSLVHKSNCNFFEIRDGLFSHVAVYMAGENTLMRS